MRTARKTREQESSVMLLSKGFVKQKKKKPQAQDLQSDRGIYRSEFCKTTETVIILCAAALNAALNSDHLAPGDWGRSRRGVLTPCKVVCANHWANSRFRCNNHQHSPRVVLLTAWLLGEIPGFLAATLFAVFAGRSLYLARLLLVFWKTAARSSVGKRDRDETKQTWFVGKAKHWAGGCFNWADRAVPLFRFVMS